MATSIPVVGSSRRTMDGLPTRAMPVLNLRLLPPLRKGGGKQSNLKIPIYYRWCIERAWKFYRSMPLLLEECVNIHSEFAMKQRQKASKVIEIRLTCRSHTACHRTWRDPISGSWPLPNFSACVQGCLADDHT